MLFGLSEHAIWGAVELGLIYSLVAIGVYLTFRVLDFPDLTVDGSFPLGGVVCAVLIAKGWDPWMAMGWAFCAGALAGFVTAFISVQFGILNLLASILTMTALFSINIRITGGRSNQSLLGEPTVLDPILSLNISDFIARPMFIGIIVVVIVVLLAAFLSSELGLAMRATGANARMALANGVKTRFQMIFGVAISNSLVALAGALNAQVNGVADVTQGVGTIVTGLAAVILGETLLPAKKVMYLLIACLLGSIVYRITITIAMELGPLGLISSDINQISAYLVLTALLIPRYWRKMKS